MKDDLNKFVLTHSGGKGGNGWVIVEECQKPNTDMVRVAMVGKDGIGKQAFLAWRNLLSIEMVKKDPMLDKSPLIPHTIPTSVMDQLSDLRQAIRDGTKKIISTHIQAA